MKNYLLSCGIAEEDIILEDKSTNTYENMLNSKNIINDDSSKVLYSTTNYHVFRSGIMARRVGMKAIGIGSKTKWYFWPNALVREFVGLVANHKIKQLIILIIMLVIYTVLTILNYSL